MAGLAGLALATPATAQQEACGAFSVTDAEHVSLIPAPGYTVLTAIPPLAFPGGQIDIDAVVCDRAGIFIGPVDHRVLTDLSVPLYIRHDGRIAVLEMREGRLQVRVSQGTLREGEADALAEALDRAEAAIAAGAH